MLFEKLDEIKRNSQLEVGKSPYQTIQFLLIGDNLDIIIYNETLDNQIIDVAMLVNATLVNAIKTTH